MKKIKRTIPSISVWNLMLALMLSVFTVAGQNEPDRLSNKKQPLPKQYTDSDLRNFAEATKKVQQIQMQFQEEMTITMKEENIDPQTFANIAQSRQNPNDAMVYSDEEMAAYNRVMDKVEERRGEINGKMEEALDEYDMTIDKYQEMALTVQQSPQLQQRVEEMMME